MKHSLIERRKGFIIWSAHVFKLLGRGFHSRLVWIFLPINLFPEWLASRVPSLSYDDKTGYYSYLAHAYDFIVEQDPTE